MKKDDKYYNFLWYKSVENASYCTIYKKKISVNDENDGRPLTLPTSIFRLSGLNPPGRLNVGLFLILTVENFYSFECNVLQI